MFLDPRLIVLDLIMSIGQKDFGIKGTTYLVTSYLYERKIFFQL